MKKLLLTGAGAVALAASGLALAGPGMPDMPKMDANDDGSISQAEAVAASDAMFFKMDANKDGKIDDADRDARKRQMFDEIDSNKDGKLTKTEAEAAQAKRMAEMRARWEEKRDERFAKMDANGDKAVSFEEFEAMRGPGMRGGPDGDGPGDGDGRRGHHGKRGGPGGPDGHGGMMMKLADTDNDGAVSAEEARAAALKMFEKLDADGDNVVTQAERQAFRDEHRGQWKERKAAQ